MHVVRYVLVFSTALVALFPSSVRPQATNQTVTAIDSRISYVGEWTVQDGGGHIFTSVSGSFSLEFTGSAIYWYSRKLYNGAVAQITLDDNEAETLDLSDGMGQNDAAVVAVLYAKGGLDAGTSHSFTVTWEGPGSNGVGSFLENYHLVLTSGTKSSSSTSSTSSTSSSTAITSSSSSSSASSSSNTSPASSPSSSPSSSPTSSSTSSASTGSSSTVNSSMLPDDKSYSDYPSTSHPTYTTITSSGVTLTSVVTASSTIAATASQLNVGAIAGGVVGGILGLFIALCAILLCLRGRRSRTASLHDMQSATPFHPLQDPTQPPIPPLISPSSIKQRPDADGFMSASGHQEQDRLYVLVDPAYLSTLRSSGAAGPVGSPSAETPSSSSAPFEALRNWMRQRSESSQGSAGWSPQSNMLSPINITYAFRGNYGTSSIPTTMALTPLSPQDAYDEPPPDYRN